MQVETGDGEFWRKEKERGQDSPILNRAKTKVGEGLKAKGLMRCLR